MLSEDLKEQTKTLHQQLESLLIPRMKAIGDRQDYIDLLNLFYEYFGGLEHKINLAADLSMLPDQLSRRKISSLEEDLNYFESSAPAIASDQYLPEIKTPFEALGALYVIEGSTLGGQHITQMIARQLDRPTHPGFAFFNGYKDATQQMWATFKKTIDGLELSENQQKEVIEAANDTFLKFQMWISRRAQAIS